MMDDRLDKKDSIGNSEQSLPTDLKEEIKKEDIEEQTKKPKISEKTVNVPTLGEKNNKKEKITHTKEQ